jgi:hypothetical protein
VVVDQLVLRVTKVIHHKVPKDHKETLRKVSKEILVTPQQEVLVEKGLRDQEVPMDL